MIRITFAILFTSILLATSLSGQAPAATGQVDGQVRFVGTPPAAKSILVTDGTTIQHRDLIIDAKTKGLEGVFVMLADARPQPPVRDAKPVLVDQRIWVFVPRVVAVREGQSVSFDNNDQVNHGVQTTAVRPGNQFNVTIGPGQPLHITFEHEKDPIVVGCALHSWMRAWVYVVRHPWFAVTDPHGRFTLKDVPPGKYRFRCSHPDTGLQADRDVTVTPGGTERVTIDWEKVEGPK